MNLKIGSFADYVQISYIPNWVSGFGGYIFKTTDAGSRLSLVFFEDLDMTNLAYNFMNFYDHTRKI